MFGDFLKIETKYNPSGALTSCTPKVLHQADLSTENDVMTKDN